MIIQPLCLDNFDEFKAYCLKHKYDHDESLLYDEDFEELEQLVNDKSHNLMVNYPTYLLVDNQILIGVFSIVQDLYMLKGGQARIRIFHCMSNLYEHYKLLFDHAMHAKEFPIDGQVEKIVFFLPTTKNLSTAIAEELGFTIDRFTYVMVRPPQDLEDITYPPHYEVVDFEIENPLHVDAYVTIRNTAFSKLKGSQTPHTRAQVIDYLQPHKLLKRGCKLLKYKDTYIGLIRLLYENEPGNENEPTKEYSFVAPLAILPEFQGRGLGALLLKTGIQVGIENGYASCMLTVNAENESALKLYKKVGFDVTYTMACYHFYVK